MDIFLTHGVITIAQEFKPGDPRPIGGSYCDVHEWAMVQIKAGLDQTKCGRCGLFMFPQELSGEIDETPVYNRRGRQVGIHKAPICIGCAPWLKNRKSNETPSSDRTGEVQG